MTDRVHALTIVLADDMREEQAQAIRDAVSLMKGVVSVGYNVSDVNTYTAKQRALHEFRNKIADILWPKF